MKTYYHANYNGHEIVLGFGNALGFINPVATWAKIDALLAATDKAKQKQAVEVQMGQRGSELRLLLQQAQAAFQSGDQVAAKRADLAAQMKQAEFDDLAVQLVPLVAAFEAKKRELFDAHTEYAHLPAGEDLINDDQHDTMKAAFDALPKGKALKADGTLVTDLRGRVAWTQKPWTRVEVTNVGVDLPKGAIPDESLTDDQRAGIAVQVEADRVAALSDDERKAEADAAKQAALAQAASKRSELEIAGAKDALAQSQAVYADATAAITAKYGQ